MRIRVSYGFGRSTVNILTVYRMKAPRKPAALPNIGGGPSTRLADRRTSGMSNIGSFVRTAISNPFGEQMPGNVPDLWNSGRASSITQHVQMARILSVDLSVRTEREIQKEMGTQCPVPANHVNVAVLAICEHVSLCVHRRSVHAEFKATRMVGYAAQRAIVIPGTTLRICILPPPFHPERWVERVFEKSASVTIVGASALSMVLIRRYETDLTDAAWKLVAPLLPAARPGGRPRTTELRLVMDAIFYVLRTGCQWRMLPHQFPPWGTVYYYFRKWENTGTWTLLHRAIYGQTRKAAGHAVSPSVVIMDGQSVKTTERGGSRGFDGYKRIKGRKRHILVDTLGLMIACRVEPVNMSDQRPANACWKD